MISGTPTALSATVRVAAPLKQHRDPRDQRHADSSVRDRQGRGPIEAAPCRRGSRSTPRLSATVRVAAPLKQNRVGASPCCGGLSATVRVAAPLKPLDHALPHVRSVGLSATVRVAAPLKRVFMARLSRRRRLCPRPSGSRPH